MSPSVGALKRWTKHLGPREMTRAGTALAVDKVTAGRLRLHIGPSLDEMIRASGFLHLETADLLAAIDVTIDKEAALRAEYAKLSAALEKRYVVAEKEGALAFPTWIAVAEQTGWLLYALIRTMRPATVVETGIANGHSSYLMLAALEANGEGLLHSFDVEPRAGGLVEDRARWRVTIDADEPQAAFRAFVDQNTGGTDLFFHDADHSYMNQLFEYRTIWPSMNPGSVFVSDDVDDSYAFLRFSKEVGADPALLFDQKKVIGALRVG